MSRIHLQRAEAIVLRRQAYGEADRILTLYTRQQGKVRAIAKGVRRIASRKSGHLELFTRCRLLLAEGRNLYLVTQAEMLEAHAPLREDLVRTAYAYHLVELVDRFTADDHANPAIFDLLSEMLMALSEAEDPSLVARYGELRLLGLAGFRPELYHCAQCTQALAEEGNRFSPSAGGAVCPACAARGEGSMALEAGAFKVLRFLQTRDWRAARTLRLSPQTRGQLERLNQAYIQHILERELSSMGFLRGLRAQAGALGLLPPDAPEADASDARTLLLDSD